MKLILVLSIIAYGYADKLDRAYLPPQNAASSGGSPGSLTAPGVQPEAFGQGLPISGHQPGLGGFGKPISSQNGLVGNIQNNPGSGSAFNPSGVENGRVTSSGNGYGPSTRISPTGGFNNPASSAISNGFRNSNQNIPSTDGQSTPGSFNQGFGQGPQGLNGIAQEYNQERPQAAADRNAETLKYTNENNGESYSYSFETSNGISAEESGIATNGVVAQGGYAYTGDDGKAYSVSYTADENGYLPQGEHLPTPHPIPEEILKSIEENAKAAAAGTQEGAYHPEEYESEFSQQQYNIGSGASYQSKPSQEQSEGPVYNPTQTNRYQANQRIGEKNLIGQTGQDSPVNQQYNTNTISGQGFGQTQQGQTLQNNQGLIQKSNQSYKSTPFQSQTQSIVGVQLTNQSPSLGFSTPNSGQSTQSQENGYQYNQPQNVFQSSSFTQSAPNQYNPEASNQRQNNFSSGQGGSGSVFKGNQGNFKPTFGNRPSTDLYGSQPSQPQIGSGELSISGNRPLPQNRFNKPQSQITPFPKQGHDNQNNQPFGFQQGKPVDQGYQYQAKQPSLGFNKPSIVKNSDSQNKGISNQPSFGSHNMQKQGAQSSVYESSKQPSFGSTSGSTQNEKLLNTIQNGVSGNNQLGQGPRFPQNTNQPSFNYNQAPGKISQYQPFGNQPSFGNRQPVQGSQFPSGGQGFGTNTLGQGPTADQTRPAQAPYQYNKPSQSFTTQPSKFLPLNPKPSNGKPGQENQDRSEDFGGPRQPPSFSSQEGYKY